MRGKHDLVVHPDDTERRAAPLPVRFGWRTVTDSPAAPGGRASESKLSGNAAPLSRTIGLRTLSADPAPLSSLVKLRPLSDQAAPLSDRVKMRTLSSEPAPLSSRISAGARWPTTPRRCRACWACRC